MKGAATAAAAQGEIVQVDGGGQILRATGRKDRHSKVYTAKGPRDRRVRLSAHTAIQFYDVQDRLGYDRPSKAVDWLIRKARAAIDRLNDQPPPPQHPTPESNPSSADPGQSSLEQQHQQQAQVMSQFDFHPNNNNNNNNNNTSYMGGADLMSTMKSLFPTSSFASFDNDPYQAPPFPARELGLSLQTLQADGRGNPGNPFQGNFHWGGGGGFSQFSHQRELLQSNTAAASLWNQRSLIPANNHDHEQPRFELGFRVPARIYGEEEAAENHR